MSNPTSNFNWQMPTATDLVTDLPADFEVFGQAVDTSLADLKGGTTGQILAKNTNADMDFVWTSPNPGDITGVTAGTGISGGGTSGDVTITNSMATAIDAKGDLVPGTGADTFARLAVGANDTVLTADSSTATGLKWATPSSGGFTQLATGTLSGASTTVSLTLTGYRDLVVNVANPIASTSSTNFQITLGGTSTYQSNQMYSINGAASANRTTSADNKIEWQFGSLFAIPTSSDNRNSTTLQVFNVTATNGKTAQLNLGLAGPSRVNCFQSIVLEEANAITGITFTTTSGTFSGGTYTIWGVK